ncbi:response regulator transcription factor [Spirosoma luteum]|uniref:response regulator transcription factor n=1 Tax=Spirosoma luteum TaxID=431553 RepID=UPI00035C988A|nr:response regulator [Spirosoma luteum]
MAITEPTTGLAGDKPVLLLVEDNDDMATYIKACVQDDYQVLWAENGQTGIELALEKVPDLILSDVLMPKKDGFQLCETLKNDQRTSHIPIVLLTAMASVSDKISGLQHGADGYLAKPFQREELTVVLANLLQSRRLLQLHYSRLALGNQADNALDESLEAQFLHKLRSAIEGQLDNPHLSIGDVCQLIGMGRTSLYLKMAALTGMSINKYVRSLRLSRARELLLASTLNISEVAYAVGFEDPKYFSRVFSKEFGITPGNFRLLNRG